MNPALRASVDQLDACELDELIEYAPTKRAGAILVTDEQRATPASRRIDADPADWFSDNDFDARIGFGSRFV